MKNTSRTEANHYETLGIDSSASQQQVKQAYRRLAKQFHPDGANAESTHDKIAAVNAAYEVLGDAQERHQYDARRQKVAAAAASDRATRTVTSHNQYRRKRSARQETTVEQWLRTVYNPTDRLIGQIIKPLKAEVRALSADPFDDELMADFQTYLETCQETLEKARAKFRSLPNPAGVASGAANLYYCLNQLEDGIEEMERFTYTYDDGYLHTGQELFRISTGLRKEARAEIKALL